MLTPTKIKIHKAVPDQKESGDFADCPQPVYDVLSVVLATDEHRSLSTYKFRLLFKKKISHRKGRRTLATVKILSPQERLISDGADILIVIDWFFWMGNPEKQEPLLFHELCHLQLDEESNLVSVGHDLEEFRAVIEKYGDWNRDVLPFAKAIKQFDLFELGEKTNAVITAMEA
ncbi:MAG: hypothetical protein MH252_08310 [Thermosynechococcaceae cyanobacterium MS004]|nr:hypothetical protein [Thermosynechococcaceae cyanobacterium MS004]